MKAMKLLSIFVFSILLFVSTAAQDAKPLTFTVAATGETVELGAHTPNEMPGFRFFGDGRLNALKLGVSTREEVRKIFGKPHESSNENYDFFDYDRDWEIKFYYISASDRNTNYLPSHIPASEYVGKLRTVALFPKKAFSMTETIFPAAFKKYSGGGYYPKEYVAMDLYRDDYGLNYEIFRKSDPPSRTLRSGDLVSIRYHIPHQLMDRMFITPPNYYEVSPKRSAF